MRFFSLGLIISALTCQCQAYEYEFFSAKKSEMLVSDPDQPLIRTLFTHSLGEYFNQMIFWDIGIGGAVPLLSANDGAEERAGVNVLGDFRSRFAVNSKSFDLLNADYTGGLNLVIRKPFSLPGDMEVYLFHKSSHLGDEAILDTATYHYRRINYSREVVRLLYYGTLSGAVRHAYGAHYILRKDPVAPRGRLALQYNVAIPFRFIGGRFFANSNFKCNEEHAWNMDVNVQFGIRLGKETNRIFSQKLILEFYNGYSRLGQFYDKRERNISLGIIAHI